MIHRIRLFVVALTFLAPTLVLGQDPFAAAAGTELETVDLSTIESPAFPRLLANLKAQGGITPQGRDVLRLPGNPEILVIPLKVPDEPENRLFLYYLPSREEPFFFQVQNTPTGPEARLWGRGDAEILLSEKSVVLIPQPSKATFRLPQDLASRTAPSGLQGQTAPLTIDEVLSCIAQSLSVSTDNTSLLSFLSSVTCSATNKLALALTAVVCLNPSPISLVACTVSIARLISCSLVNCNTPPSSDCLRSIQLPQNLADTWASGCNSTHRLGRFARYYTFSLAATTPVQIDLSSSVDTYLFLLRGSGSSGSVEASDDDGGPGTDSRITRILPAGTYTLEATTYWGNRTGSFMIRLSRP